ncbi:MAG: tetratricopeptide repeat protein [candidate division NC10 bacterium]|nr:tetratricopeptide repeat protein [candidate division NC10 bacterium]
MIDPGRILGAAGQESGDGGRPSGGSRRTDLRLGALLALVAAALYLGTLRYGFVWDDFQLVFFNQFIRRLSALPSWIGLTADEVSFGDFSGRFYRPGTFLALALDFWVWGERSSGFHLTNVLLHTAVTFAVFWLARDLFPRPGPAMATALLFAVHPVHVEAVAWVSARADLLATLWLTIGLLAYRRARPAGGGLRLGWYAAALLAGVAGLSCKETAAALPLLLLVADLLGTTIGMASAGGFVSLAVRSLPFWGLAAGHLAFLSGPFRTLDATLLAPGDLWGRLPGALETLARYLGLLLFPLTMRPFYDLPRPDSLLAPWPLLGGLLLLGLLLALWRLWRRRPTAAFGLAWLLITLGPVLDLVAVSPRPMGLADRYLYLPSIGFLLWAVGVAEGARSWWGGPRQHLPSHLPAVAVALLAFGWTALTAGYLPVWRDNLSLYSRMVRDFPDAGVPRLNLATTYLDMGETGRGIAELETAIRRQPMWARPQIMLGLVLVGTGDRARGFALFDRAAPLAQDDIHYYRTRAEAHLVAQAPERAAEVARAGLRRFPRAVELTRLLAQALEATGDIGGAVAMQRDLLRWDPRLASAHEALGRLMVRQQDFAGAAEALTRALELEPDRLLSLRLLALIRQAEGRREESLRLWNTLEARAHDPAIRAEAQARIRALTPGRPTLAK